METELRVGVLAIQGAFAEHAHNLQCAFTEIKAHNGLVGKDADLKVIEVRKVEHLVGLDGIILPGGESTTMSKFLERNGFQEAIARLVHGTSDKQAVVWGTCAGLILLSANVTDMKTGGQKLIGGLDITTSRNAYGRQYDSFEANISLLDSALRSTDNTESKDSCPGVFIRAPEILSVDGESVNKLAVISRNNQERVVAVQQGHVIGTSFHPELTDDFTWHTYFLRTVIKSRAT